MVRQCYYPVAVSKNGQANPLGSYSQFQVSTTAGEGQGGDVNVGTVWSKIIKGLDKIVVPRTWPSLMSSAPRALSSMRGDSSMWLLLESKLFAPGNGHVACFYCLKGRINEAGQQSQCWCW